MAGVGSRQCMYIEPIQVNVKKLDEALTNWALKMNWGSKEGKRLCRVDSGGRESWS